MILATQLTLFTLTLFTTTSCGKVHEKLEQQKQAIEPPPPPTEKQSIEGVHFNDAFPLDHRNRIVKDLYFLQSLSLTPSVYTQGLQKLIKKPNELTGLSLFEWLQQGMHFILSKDFNEDANISYTSVQLASQVAHPLNYTSFPGGFFSLHNEIESTKIMVNLGPNLWLKGRNQKSTAVLNIPGIGKVQIYSPRVGIFQEADGLFGDMTKSNDIHDIREIIFRLSTYLHERRHDDGNIKSGSFAFGHSICTSGPYKGKHACDNNVNGPYMASALMFKAYHDTCKTCDPQKLKLLEFLYYDNLGRITIPNPLQILLSDNKDISIWDETPENE